MSIIRDFVAEVGGIAALAPLGGRIHPLVDHGQALPSLVYNNRGLVQESYVQGSFGLRETFIQMDLYSNSYAELDTLRTAIINHFNGFTGAFNASAMDGGTVVSSCKIVTSRELIESGNNRVYRAILELNVLSE